LTGSAHYGAVLALIVAGGQIMESKAKFLGHPIHPMLIVLPLGLFISAVALDAIYMWNGNTALALVGFWNIAGGIAGGLLAAAFGFIDWLAIPARTRAKRIGLFHGGLNVAVVLTFAAVWLDRNGTLERLPSTTNFVVELAAIGAAMVAGWLGGELVDRLGVGVDEGAHLNAPSSLSGLPANGVRAK
jgi:uncharacterized membrane protein